MARRKDAPRRAPAQGRISAHLEERIERLALIVLTIYAVVALARLLGN